MVLTRQNVSFFVFVQCLGVHDTNIRQSCKREPQILKQTIHRDCCSEMVLTAAMWGAGPRLSSQLHSLSAMSP